jgi:hypothetical protein
VPTREQTEGELGLVDHGRNHKARAAAPLEEVEARRLLSNIYAVVDRRRFRHNRSFTRLLLIPLALAVAVPVAFVLLALRPFQLSQLFQLALGHCFATLLSATQIFNKSQTALLMNVSAVHQGWMGGSATCDVLFYSVANQPAHYSACALKKRTYVVAL